ncbi:MULTISPECIES: polysaccharide biosynthesis/export family protein [unclassified Flavobacterium]|jgi:polysaccharide export outer membrane protein|uniref:polysaccharide biosynthesis/export family protein n=1 Tax=unclassified Flavobacterium TaxID=196869 RepID=UPI0012FE92C6|nr:MULTISPECIES: polysaccharide biosynthesis/export family protein [unclassified Flavobacterium]MDQ1166726.1 polysaccharide export outer membrane protein [Flavobacterium sp. SORGH_AS_0622]
MKKISFSIILLLLMMLQSCTTKKQMLYLQDLDKYANTTINYTSPKIQPNDILKIDVGDLNPLVAAPFNINNGTNNSQTSVEMMRLSGYLVNPQGTIMMPILNEVKVGGLTPANVEVKIKERLISENYLVNPTVQVRVLNNKFTILGEVNSPGVIAFSEESISLLDAIGLAKDLTYSAIRTDIQLIRESEGKRLVYHIDLTTASWMSNPNFRIRQNDVIVVTPNKLKANSGGVIKDPLQLIGIVASLAALIIVIAK